MTRLGSARIVAGTFLLAACTVGCAVQWTLDYNEGVRLARQQNKPLMLYFKDWSSSQHREMVVHVFESPVVAGELTHTVNVELLYNWGREAERYHIRTSQVCVMCRPDGSEVDRFHATPLPAPEKFAEWARRTRATAGAPPATQPATRPIR